MTSIWRTIVVYAVGLGIIWVALPLSVPSTRRALTERNRVLNEQLAAEIDEILTRHGVDRGSRPRSMGAEYRVWEQSLPDEAREDVVDARESHEDKSIGLLTAVLAVTTAIYALVGFCCGLASREYVLIGAIPAAHYFAGNVLVKMGFLPGPRLGVGKNLALRIVFLAAWVVACYVLAYVGASIGRAQDARRWKRR
jgi:hypothetical protein